MRVVIRTHSSAHGHLHKTFGTVPSRSCRASLGPAETIVKVLHMASVRSVPIASVGSTGRSMFSSIGAALEVDHGKEKDEALEKTKDTESNIRGGFAARFTVCIIVVFFVVVFFKHLGHVLTHHQTKGSGSHLDNVCSFLVVVAGCAFPSRTAGHALQGVAEVV